MHCSARVTIRIRTGIRSSQEQYSAAAIARPRSSSLSGDVRSHSLIRIGFFVRPGRECQRRVAEKEGGGARGGREGRRHSRWPEPEDFQAGDGKRAILPPR